MAVLLVLAGILLLALGAAHYLKILRRLRESEFRSRRILESTQTGFLRIDVNRVLVEVNQAFSEIVGHPVEAIVGRTLAEFMTPESARLNEKEVRKRQAGMKTSYEVALLRPDGALRHCQFHGTPVYDEHGDYAGAFALINDISERMARDAYVRQAVTVFENTLEGVMLSDLRGRIVSVNPAFTAITGYTAAEIIGSDTTILRSGRHEPAFYRQMWKEILANGIWQGEVWNRRKNGEIYPQWLTISAVRDAAGDVQSYVGVFSDISQIKRSAEELERLAHYDPLTGLANRLLLSGQLEHALERAVRYNEHLAVMVLDLDGFKNVNDTLGHPAGDVLLQQIAQRLKETLRGEDIVARLGGDEFAFVLESISDPDHAACIAEKIIAVVAEPLDLHGQHARVTGSIGIALYPSDGDDVTSLLKAADTALFVGKREGRNTYRFYSDRMAREVRQRHEMEQGLRLAIERNELELWYQPQVALESGKVAGAEVLVRWRHPERGVVSPMEFLPVACDTGLIVPLGEWVLRSACHQIRDWRARGINIERIAVNVDGLQIVRSDFFATVERVLAETEIPAHCLELEITEGFLLENAENGMGTVTRFADKGVSVAIDDFGTGYSSLVYLKYLNANCLKIDKCFVCDLPGDDTSGAIIRSVISLGRGLGFTLVAEGVETAEQLAYLRKIHCDLVQGYYFAKPMPVQEFESWLNSGELALRLAA